MTTLPGFTVDVDHNPYLPPGGRHVGAVVTVSAVASDDPPLSAPGAAGNSAEIIIVDCSLSMGMPEGKIIAARDATVAAVNVIRDGTWFAVIGGARKARAVYPPDGTMAVASEQTRDEARRAVQQLKLRIGTHMSGWLSLAHRTFQSCPATLRHAILLTDGENLEPPGRLEQAIARCEGTFRCDCRGWAPNGW